MKSKTITLINEEVKQKNKAEQPLCPLCSYDKFVKLAGNKVLGKDFSVLECNSCSLLMTHPKIKPEEFTKYYTKDYSPYKPENSLQKIVNKQISRIDSRPFRKKLNKGSDVLEIGCSSGNFMNYLKTQGYNVWGIEPGEEAAQRARDAGLDVKTVSLEDFQTDKKFDLIIMKSVLEHLADPITGLKKISSLLKKDGKIFCILPNAASAERKFFGNDWYAWHLPYHCFHYNSQTIRLLAEQAGLGIHSVSYSYLPIIIMWSISLKLERKGYAGMAKYFKGHNPIINLILLPFSFVFGLTGKSSEMRVVLNVRQ